MIPVPATTRRFAVGGVLALLATAGSPTTAAAQVEDSIGVPVDSVIVTPRVPVTALPVDSETTAPEPLTPREAFVRSMILPGWGQAAFGSYFRGGVYFAGWAGNWFMNFKNAVRLDDARDVFALRRGELRDSLLFSTENPDSMAAVLDTTDLLRTTVRNDSAGEDLRLLVRAREQQREDWIFWTMFWLLASGVDGYVTAQLADFPAAIEIAPNRDGSFSLRLEVPLGRRRP